jgi:alpha-L-fucosidase
MMAAVLVCLGAEPSVQGQRAGWFRAAGWGVFMHYLADSADLPAAEWNRRIDAFDVEGLARQLESAKARYFFITLGQNSGHYLSPNKTYDSFAGIHPSKCSRRDLVADLYAALEPRGIKLLVYLPSGAPDRDNVAMERLQWQKGPQRNREFQQKWEQVIAEWSTRWGGKVKGWWFDGCYWPNTMYRHAEAPNFASFAAAARKGNPDSIVAFNRGVVVPIHAESAQEDYTAGEIDAPANVSVGGFWVDGAQWHMLSYLGKWWSGPPARFTTEEAVKMTTRAVAKGGVVTWDVPHRPDGLIEEPFLGQLRAIGEAVAGGRR